MNILFDLKSPQLFIGGGGEYVRKVYFSLLNEIKSRGVHNDVKIYGLHDSQIGQYAYADLSPISMQKHGTIPVDVNNSSLRRIIKEHKIDKVFIGIAQYWGESLDVENINVPCICIIHDLCKEDYADSRIMEILNAPMNWWNYNKKYLGHLKRSILGHYKDPLSKMQKILEMPNHNPNVQFVVVSEYTRTSFAYHFDYPIDSIKVLYSCPRLIRDNGMIEDKDLLDIITSEKKYYLMLSANRPNKNPEHAFNAFERYIKVSNPQAYLVTTGCKEKRFNNHIPLEYLSDNDLVQATRHCYALLFPSFMEGFGYPPIEAMGFGKPVLCSNVTSIPEICGDAAIYFSPLYESDIFRALNILNDDNYDLYSKLSSIRYKEVLHRQTNDLEVLINMILL